MKNTLELTSIQDASQKPFKTPTTTQTAIIKPRGNFIFRQELKSYTPTCNSIFGIIWNLSIMVAAFLYGIPSLILANRKKEIKIEYTKCFQTATNDFATLYDGKCILNFTLDSPLKEPLFIYYQIDNMYLNHRKFVKSKVWDQLRGEKLKKEHSNCKNAWTMKEMFGETSPYYTNEWGHKFSPNDPANPCGLFARSMFNDTYELKHRESGLKIKINETEISNRYLKNKFFKRGEDYKHTQWIDVENEHFINWMNVETFHNFRKLWGRITEDIQKGDYQFIVNDNYNITLFNAKKYVVLTNANPLGDNNFVGWLLISVGIYSFLVVLLLWVLILSNREKMLEINTLKYK